MQQIAGILKPGVIPRSAGANLPSTCVLGPFRVDVGATPDVTPREVPLTDLIILGVKALHPENSF